MWWVSRSHASIESPQSKHLLNSPLAFFFAPTAVGKILRPEPQSHLYNKPVQHVNYIPSGRNSLSRLIFPKEGDFRQRLFISYGHLFFIYGHSGCNITYQNIRVFHNPEPKVNVYLEYLVWRYVTVYEQPKIQRAKESMEAKGILKKYLLVEFPCICIIHFDSLPISLELKGRTLTATFTEAPDMVEAVEFQSHRKLS